MPAVFLGINISSYFINKIRQTGIRCLRDKTTETKNIHLKNNLGQESRNCFIFHFWLFSRVKIPSGNDAENYNNSIPGIGVLRKWPLFVTSKQKEEWNSDAGLFPLSFHPLTPLSSVSIKKSLCIMAFKVDAWTRLSMSWNMHIWSLQNRRSAKAVVMPESYVKLGQSQTKFTVIFYSFSRCFCPK